MSVGYCWYDMTRLRAQRSRYWSVFGDYESTENPVVVRPGPLRWPSETTVVPRRGRRPARSPRVVSGLQRTPKTARHSGKDEEYRTYAARGPHPAGRWTVAGRLSDVYKTAGRRDRAHHSHGSRRLGRPQQQVLDPAVYHRYRFLLFRPSVRTPVSPTAYTDLEIGRATTCNTGIAKSWRFFFRNDVIFVPSSPVTPEADRQKNVRHPTPWAPCR